MANELEIPVISDKFLTSLGETIKGLDKLDASAKTTRKSLDKTFDDSQLIDFSTGVRTVDKSFDSISDSAKDYEKSLDGVVESQKEWIAGSRKLKDVEQDTNKVEKAIDGVSKAQDNIAQNTERSGGMLQKFIGGIGSAFKAFIALQIVDKLVGFVRGLGDLIRQVDEFRGKVSLVTRTTGEELNNATAKIRSIADIFPQISPEATLIAASNASKQFGEDINTVLDTIQAGLAQTGGQNEKFIDSFEKYSAVATDAGLTLQQFNELLVKSTEEGVFSDKGIAAIKESSTRLKEFGAGAEKALTSAFGKDFTKEIKLKISEGDTFGAIQKVSEGLNNSNLSAQQVQSVVNNIFGGAGKIAGVEFLKTLKDIDGALEDVGGEAQANINEYKALLEVTNEYEKASAELAEAIGGTTDKLDLAFLTIKAVGLRAFVEIIKVVQSDLSPAIINLANTFKGFIDRLGFASKESSIFSTILNGIVGVIKIFTNIITVAINGISALIKVYQFLYENIQIVRSAFDGVIFVVKGFAQALLNLPEIVNGIAGAISSFFSDIGFNLAQFATNVRAVFSSFGNIKEWLKGNISLNDGFKDAGKSAANAFSSAFQKELTLKEKLQAELEQLGRIETTLRIQGFNEDADRIKAQIKGIGKQLKELEKPIKPPKILGEGDNLGLTPEEIAKQKELKQKAEELAKDRAKVLADIEAKFIEQKKQLTKEAEQIEIESLKDSAEKIKLRHELVLREIDERGEEIKLIKAQIEVRKDVEAGRFKGNDADIELEAKRRVTSGLVQLEQTQVEELDKIRAAANSNYVDELGVFNEAVFKATLERLQGIKDKEQASLVSRLEGLQAEFELNKSAIEAQTDFVDDKGNLIKVEAEQEKERQKALLTLQQDFLQKQIAFYSGLSAAQAELFGGQTKVDATINNLQTQLNAVGKEIKNIDLDADIDIFKLLGINIDDESKRLIIDSIKDLAEKIGSVITSSIDRQIADQKRLIESIDEQVSARENAVEREKELMEAGFANNYEAEKTALDALQSQREEAVEKKLQLEKRAAAVNKAAAIGQILTAQAVAIAELLKMSSGNPLNLLTAGIAGQIQFAAGIIQIISTIGSVISILNSAPKLKKGKSRITGGREGEDSVLSWLMPNEAVIPVETAEPNRGLMEGLVENSSDKVRKSLPALFKNFNIDLSELMAAMGFGGALKGNELNIKQPGTADSAFISLLSNAKSNLRQLEVQQSMLEVSKRSYEELQKITHNTGKTANNQTVIAPSAEGYTQITVSDNAIETVHKTLSKPVETIEAKLLKELIIEVKKMNGSND